MGDSNEMIRRKVRKLLRDPRLFFTDALLKRTAYQAAHGTRPYVLFEGRPGAQAFSAQELIEQIAERYPVLHSIDERDFQVGILEKHVISIIQHLVCFAERHGHHLTIRADRTVESPAVHVSERLLNALRTASSFVATFKSLHCKLLEIRFHVYRRRGSGLANTGPIAMQYIPADVSEFLSEGATGQFWPTQLLGSAVSPQEPAEEIDVVYTWVDSSDAQWRQLYEQYYHEKVDQDRYSSRDELRYSMRSLHYYCGWVRKVFVVSNCSPPDWLDIEHEKIVWVDHKAILNSSNLPTFNCHAIETGLIDIEGLSERFLYLNDDFFVTRPLRRRAFFDEAGRTQTFLEPAGKIVPDRQKHEPAWFEARLTAQRTLLERYACAATRNAYHAPYVIRRSRAREMFDDLAVDVERIAATRRRSVEDIPLLSFLYGHWALAQGHGVRSDLKAQMLGIHEFSKFALSDDTAFLCVNDGGGSAENEDFVQMTQLFMEQRFPHPAPWER